MDRTTRNTQFLTYQSDSKLNTMGKKKKRRWKETGQKVKLSLHVPWMHTGGAELQLHSLSVSAQVEMSDHLHVPADFLPEKNPDNHWKGS